MKARNGRLSISDSLIGLTELFPLTLTAEAYEQKSAKDGVFGGVGLFLNI